MKYHWNSQLHIGKVFTYILKPVEWIRKNTFTPYAQIEGSIPMDKELDNLLKKAMDILKTLDGISNCHTAAKEFHRLTGLGIYRRGWYSHRLWEHSWIEFPTFVLDIYPVGGARPLCVAKIVADANYLLEMPKAKNLLPMT